MKRERTMKQWMVYSKRADFDAIGRKYGIDPVIARIIRNRDIVEEEQLESFLHPGLDKLHNPFQLKDIEKAADIIKEKIQNQKRICIVNDYDIDGICSGYILENALKRLGALVEVKTPERIRDGYGINLRIIEEAYKDKTDTILTCDNGIAAMEPVAYAKELGMTVIITDHHEVPYELKEGRKKEQLPAADAIINPKQQQCSYPYTEICGAVVAYKLIQVLWENMGRPEEEALEYLEYAAIATIGDVMDLKDENYSIVKYGLTLLNHTKNLGLRALIQKNQLRGEISAYHVGFVLGPCLNASGRLETAKKALDLLKTESDIVAEQLAEELTKLNARRKEMTEQETKKAIQMALSPEYETDKVLVLYLPNCHESIAGIVAGRVREEVHKPIYVLTKSDEAGIVKGSGRSIEEYSMYEELTKCNEYLSRYGGHAMAAGLSLLEKNLPSFRESLNANTSLTKEDLIETVWIDVPMPMDYVTRSLIDQLSLLEPFGKGNEKPVFADRELKVNRMDVVGKNHNVCRLNLQNIRGKRFLAVYFGNVEKFMDYYADKYGRQEIEKARHGQENQIVLSVTYYPDIHVYQGMEQLQYIIKHYS